MITTLRITSLLAMILAGVVLIFPAFIGLKTGGDAALVQNLPNAVEQFKQSRSEGKDKSRKNAVSPLVRQAESFAQHLNPAARASDVPSPASFARLSTLPRPETVSAKFTLLGTSYHASDPNLSLALIDEPGRGLRWVRQSSQIGHLIIEQVKDGCVVIRNGPGTYELTVEEKSLGVSLIEGQQTQAPRASLSPAYDALKGSRPVSTASIATGVKQPVISPVLRAQPEPQISEEEQKAMADLVEKLRGLQKSLESENSGPQDHNALLEKLVSDFKASHVTDEEANDLSNLGEQLKATGQDANRPQTTPKKPPVLPKPVNRKQ